MTDTFTLAYRAPDGRTLPVTAARADGQLFFPLVEIAQALLYECPERMRPTCDEVETRTLTLQGKRYPRKCVTLEGLFCATPASRTDNGTEAAAGPARHFHAWLRAVMLPAAQRETWPPDANAVLDLQLEWVALERDRLSDYMRDLESTRAGAVCDATPDMPAASADDPARKPLPDHIRASSHAFPATAPMDMTLDF